MTTATALPARFYVDAEIEALEEARIFRRSWQLLGHLSRLAGPGDHVVGRIGSLPLVVLRDHDGRLRAFHNVCRHRAGPVARCDGQGARALVCHYHGWTYGLDGKLKRAPEMEESDSFNPDEIALPEERAADWQGLVFATAGRSPEFGEWIHGIDERLGDRGLGKYRPHRRQAYDINCNWKVYIDNFLEGYHLPRVHPELNRLLDYRSYRTELADWHSLQWSPLESEGNPYGRGDALYFYLWPNTMLNALPGRLQTNRVIPLAVDRSRVVFEYFYPEDTDPGTLAEDERLSDQIQREDIEICEAVHRGMASGSWETGPLNPGHETGVAHFQALYRCAVELE